MLIYFAGPLFCPAERIFNTDLTKKLEHLGFSVFLPQGDDARSEGAQQEAPKVIRHIRQCFWHLRANANGE